MRSPRPSKPRGAMYEFGLLLAFVIAIVLLLALLIVPHVASVMHALAPAKVGK